MAYFAFFFAVLAESLAGSPKDPALLRQAPLLVSAVKGKSRWTIAGKAVSIVTLSMSTGSEIWVSESCWRPDSRKGTILPVCQAFAALSRVSLRGLRLSGGANPGAAACIALGARVQPALDIAGNENGFCLFDDGSLVSDGALAFYGKVNDGPR